MYDGGAARGELERAHIPIAIKGEGQSEAPILVWTVGGNLYRRGQFRDDVRRP